MGGRCLRHRTDGAKRIVDLSRGYNTIARESHVFIISSRVAAITCSTDCSITSYGISACSASTAEFGQELVFVLDTPFVRPQLEENSCESSMIKLILVLTK